MKIAFFGVYYACHYYHLGGTDSFVRRIATELVGQGDRVDYVLYGQGRNEVEQIRDGLRMCHLPDFTAAWRHLIAADYDHVVTIYLPPRDRLQFGIRRLHVGKSPRFHVVYFGWPDNPVRRELLFADSRLFRYNGKVFAISSRQLSKVRAWAPDALLLLPPVPASYFTTPQEKPISDKLRVSWIGRLDAGKGAFEVVELFRRLSQNPDLDLTLCGHRWAKHEEVIPLQNYLMEQKEFRYINTGYDRHSPEVEQLVGNILLNTDVFLLPYRRLSSTIDTPLLLLEAMAALAAVISKPMGNVAEVYGNASLLLEDGDNYLERVEQAILGFRSRLPEERKRLYAQVRLLASRSDKVASRFRDWLDV